MNILLPLVRTEILLIPLLYFLIYILQVGSPNVCHPGVSSRFHLVPSKNSCALTIVKLDLKLKFVLVLLVLNPVKES